MRTLDRKLVRELRRHWVQVISIALVMACGVMTIMGLRSTEASIVAARDQYFTAYRFADVFAVLQRAPSSVAARIATIPGVSALETRIVRDVKLNVPGLAEPAIGHVVSIPEIRRAMLNDLHIRRGRWIAPDRDDEVLISDRFAELNKLNPGDSLAAVINGRWHRFHIVGVALSPEFVVELAAGAVFVDNRRFGILWTSSRALETAFDMKGAFNDVAVRLAPGASEQGVINALDALLRPWGEAGAYGRHDQAAARTLEDEFSQLRTNATFFPGFFLIVAAFLLNVVLSRLVTSQRDEIAALKAFGYSDREIGVHYLGFGVASVTLGALLGIPFGVWMSSKFTHLYADYFRFPTLPAVVDWSATAVAIAISGGFALLGTLSAVKRVMALKPAEALRPESPAHFRPLVLERLGFGGTIGPSARMVLRNLERRPVRTASAMIGLALAVALLSSGRFPYDALDRMMDVQFRTSQRYDALASFTTGVPVRAARDLRSLPGVALAEPFRSAAVRVRRGAVSRSTVITGIERDGLLFRLADVNGDTFVPPPAGIVISTTLASTLGATPGDTVSVELLERGSEQRRVVVAGLFDAMMGQGLYTSRPFLSALLHEQDEATGAYLLAVPGEQDQMFAELKNLSGVASAVSRIATIRMINEQMRDSMVFVLALISASASVIAIGVVYNSARIALSERGRELASLRVLGFTTNEVSGMLFGEQLAMLVPALPLGLAFGALFNLGLAHAFQTERFHFPYVLTLRSQTFSALVVAAAALTTGLAIRRRVRRLALVAALRTRE